MYKNDVNSNSTTQARNIKVILKTKYAVVKYTFLKTVIMFFGHRNEQNLYFHNGYLGLA